MWTYFGEGAAFGIGLSVIAFFLTRDLRMTWKDSRVAEEIESLVDEDETVVLPGGVEFAPVDPGHEDADQTAARYARARERR